MTDVKTDTSAEKAFEAASAGAASAKPTAKPATKAATTPKAKAVKRKPAVKRTPAAARKQTKTAKTSATKPRMTARAASPQKGSNIMNDTVKKITETAKKNGEEAKARVETMVADVNVRTREAMEKSAKSAENVVAFSKGNVEAAVESGKIAAKGLKSIGEDTVEFTRKSFENATAAAKQFAAVKTPAELFQLHGDYVRSSFDGMVKHASKNSEAMMKLAGESFQPISNRFAEAAAKIKTAA